MMSNLRLLLVSAVSGGLLCDAAERTEKAMLEVFADGTTITRDLGGTAKTADFANAIIDKLKQ